MEKQSKPIYKKLWFWLIIAIIFVIIIILLITLFSDSILNKEIPNELKGKTYEILPNNSAFIVIGPRDGNYYLSIYGIEGLDYTKQNKGEIRIILPAGTRFQIIKITNPKYCFDASCVSKIHIKIPCLNSKKDFLYQTWSISSQETCKNTIADKCSLISPSNSKILKEIPSDQLSQDCSALNITSID